MGGIFLRDGDTYIELMEQPYDTELILQDLIAQHPKILAGDETGHGKLVLVKQEAAVSDPEAGTSRWSLDHLYLDASGIPTLVEVKRASDPRLRREVVAQMLEYAANAATSWSTDRLREWFEDTCAARGQEPEAVLRETLDIEDVEAFWGRVATNLSAEQLRLVFVADNIVPELRRMIEYLNRQMQDTEVFAIEVKQYVTDDLEQQTIVPRIIGQTEAARQAKRHAARGGSWDRESILEAVAENNRAWIPIVERLYAWGDGQTDLTSFYGSGTKDGSFRWGSDKPNIWPFNVYTSGTVELSFQAVRARPPFDDLALREQLRSRFAEIPGVTLGPVEDLARPNFPLDLLATEEAFERFTSTVEWAFEQARTASSPAA
jgi:hypothetical protein